MTRHTGIKTISMCEGSIESPKWYPMVVGLEPGRLTHTMVGLNHGSWTIEHKWDGQDLISLLAQRYAENRAKWDKDPSVAVYQAGHRHGIASQPLPPVLLLTRYLA